MTRQFKSINPAKAWTSLASKLGTQVLVAIGFSLRVFSNVSAETLGAVHQTKETAEREDNHSFTVRCETGDRTESV